MNNPTIGHYEILGKLGEGGMGVVYLARDTRLNRQVALKLLPEHLAVTPEARARFIREAQSASALNSPHIVTVYEIGSHGGSDFIAMEYIRGETLADHLRRGPLGFELALNYSLQLAAALSTAHASGIVHRDLKPGNVMVGPGGLLKILDFGLAKPAASIGNQPEAPADLTTTSPLTQYGLAMGTLAYMSPEQALGAEVDTRSDIFSLGLVLYEMFTGKRPLAGPTPGDTFRRLQLDEPAPLSEVSTQLPSNLDEIIRKTLAKKPSDRYQTAGELEADLRTLLPGSGHQTAPGRILARETRPAQRRLAQLANSRTLQVAGVALAAVALLAFWQPWKLLRHEPPPSAKRWFDQGTAAILDGTYHTASLALERAVAEDPGYSLAHIRLAETYFELDALDKAKEHLLLAAPDASGSSLDSLTELYHQAVRLTVTGDFDGAARIYARIRDAVPSSSRPRALVDYGRALERAENLKAAMTAYEEASRTQSQYPSAFLRLGILHRRRMDQTLAGSAFQQAESLYRSLGNVEGLAEVNYQRGVLLNNLGNAREARPVLEQALDLARTASSDQQEIAILLQLSAVLQRLEGPDKAREYATTAIDLARSKGLEPLAARGLIDVGNSYFLAGDPSRAKDYFTQALGSARRNRSRRTEARALLSLGSLAIQQGQYVDGVKHVDSALAFYREGGYRKETSQGLLLSGRARRSMGDYDNAVKAFEEQHRRALEVGDIEQVALSLEALGSVYLMQGRLPEALQYFQEALSSTGSAPNPMAMAYTIINSSTALWRLGRYSEAEKLLGPLDSAEAGGKLNPAVRAVLAECRAAIALSRRQFSAAAAHAARILSEPEVNPAVASGARSLLAMSQAESGDPAGAIQSARQAVETAGAARLQDLSSVALTAQAIAFHAAGRHREALESAKQALSMTAAGNHERQWRIFLLASRAASAAGQREEASSYAARSAASLQEVERLLGAGGFAFYLRRPDVQFDRILLSSLHRPASNLVQVKGPAR